MKNKKHKLLKFGSIGLIASVFGIAVVGYASKENNYQPVKADNGTITIYNANQLTDLMQDYEVVENQDYNLKIEWNLQTTITTNKYNFSETDGQFYVSNDNTSVFMEQVIETTKYIYYNEEVEVPLNTQLTIYQDQSNIEIYNYLVENAPQPTSENIGSGIINAIRSGLGLIGDLASQFLLGFSTLFWNATTSTLTTFAMFSLVMLGIGITFAVIKLVLNILRSNTGA